MRITKIRSWRDFAWYCIDQTAHAIIVLAVTAWWADSPGEVGWAGVILLTIRELEQARDTVEKWIEDHQHVPELQEAKNWLKKQGHGKELAKIPTPTLKLAYRLLTEWRLGLDLLRHLHLPDRLGDITLGAALAALSFQLYTSTMS